MSKPSAKNFSQWLWLGLNVYDLNIRKFPSSNINPLIKDTNWLTAIEILFEITVYIWMNELSHMFQLNKMHSLFSAYYYPSYYPCKCKLKCVKKYCYKKVCKKYTCYKKLCKYVWRVKKVAKKVKVPVKKPYGPLYYKLGYPKYYSKYSKYPAYCPLLSWLLEFCELKKFGSHKNSYSSCPSQIQ